MKKTAKQTIKSLKTATIENNKGRTHIRATAFIAEDRNTLFNNKLSYIASEFAPFNLLLLIKTKRNE